MEQSLPQVISSATRTQGEEASPRRTVHPVCAPDALLFNSRGVERIGAELFRLLINEDNIANWRQGGYQDYVRAQIIKERAQTQIETAANLVRETPALQSPRLKEALTQIALLSYIETLMHHGHQLSRQALEKNPAKMITLMNTVCTMATTARQTAQLKDRARIENRVAAPEGRAVEAVLNQQPSTNDARSEPIRG